MFDNAIGIMTEESRVEPVCGATSCAGPRPTAEAPPQIPTCEFHKGAGCSNSAGLEPLAEHRPRCTDDILGVGRNHERFVGLPLPPDLCRAARQKELEYFKSEGVWELRSVNEARRRMGRSPICVRWVERDDLNPNIRSRLVAREIRTAGRDVIFAPTPPLESLRMVLSYAASDINDIVEHDRSQSSEQRTDPHG